MKHTLKNEVEMVLSEQPETRNSDILLTITVWRRFYGVKDSIMVSQLFDLPYQDNVKRIRAKFNSQGRYYPTNQIIAKRRGILENEWRVALGYAPKPEQKMV